MGALPPLGLRCDRMKAGTQHRDTAQVAQVGWVGARDLGPRDCWEGPLRSLTQYVESSQGGRKRWQESQCGGLRAKDESALEHSGSGEAQEVSSDLKMKVFWPREGPSWLDSSRGQRVLNEHCPLCVFQGI